MADEQLSTAVDTPGDATVPAPCPSCGHTEHLRIWEVGQRGPCAACGHTYRARVPEAEAAALPESLRRLIVQCDDCGAEHGVKASQLGYKYPCRRCGRTFRALVSRERAEATLRAVGLAAVACPVCGESYTIKRTKLGKASRCTVCGYRFLLEEVDRSPSLRTDLSEAIEPEAAEAPPGRGGRSATDLAHILRQLDEAGSEGEEEPSHDDEAVALDETDNGHESAPGSSGGSGTSGGGGGVEAEEESEPAIRLAVEDPDDSAFTVHIDEEPRRPSQEADGEPEPIELVDREEPLREEPGEEPEDSEDASVAVEEESPAAAAGSRVVSDASTPALDARARELEERESALQLREVEIDRLREGLDERQVQIVERSETLRREHEQLGRLRADLDEQRRAVEQQMADIEQQRGDLRQQRERLEADRAELDRGRAEFEAQRLAFEQEREEAEQLDEQRRAVEQQMADIEQQRGDLRQQRERLEADRAELDRGRAEFEAQRLAFERERAAVRCEREDVPPAGIGGGLAAALAEQQQQLAERRDHLDAREQQLRQREADWERAQEAASRREKQLTEQRSEVDRRCLELERAERDLRERQAAHDASWNKQEEELRTRRAELEQLQVRLEAVQERHEHDGKKLADAQASLESARSRLAEELHQIERQRTALGSLQEQVTRREADLRDRESQLLDRAARHSQLELRIEQLEEELERTERRLREARAEAAAAQQPDTGPLAVVQPSVAAPAAPEAAGAKEPGAAEPAAPAPPSRFTLARLSRRPVLDLSPDQVRTAAAYVDRRGSRHLFVDYVPAEQRTTNTWAAEIRYYRSDHQGPWNLVATAVPRGRRDEASLDRSEPDCHGAASPAIVCAGGQALLFYAGRGHPHDSAADQPPRILADRDERGCLPSRIMLAVARTDEHGFPVEPFSKRGVVLDLGETWDRLRLDQPAAIVVGDTVHLFYIGYDSPRHLDRRRVGHAVAKLGEMRFTRDPEPILTVEGGGEMPRLFRHAGAWHLLLRHFDRAHGTRWRHYLSDDLGSFRIQDAHLFDGLGDQHCDLSVLTDTEGGLPPHPAALVTAPERGVYKLWDFDLKPGG